MAQNGEFAQGGSRGPEALASLETVDADPGAVFEAHGADTVDDLVADDEPASAQPDPHIEADDADVAALFGDDLEAPRRRPREGGSRGEGAGRSGDAPAGEASGRAGRQPAADRGDRERTVSTRVSRRWDGSSGAPPATDERGDGGVEELLPDRGADVLAELDGGNDVLSDLEPGDPAADGGDPAPPAVDRPDWRGAPPAEATDEDVEAALSAAEDVYEGELPDEVPFE